MTLKTAQKQLGHDGEQIIVEHLKKNGFTICAQNYRKFFGEIDIIAAKKNLYVFVEVKTRKSNTIAMGELISPLKQKKIIKTAQTFIAENKLTQATFRFDVALVIKNNDQISFEYIENAFTQQDNHYAY